MEVYFQDTQNIEIAFQFKEKRVQYWPDVTPLARGKELRADIHEVKLAAGGEGGEEHQSCSIAMVLSLSGKMHVCPCLL